MEGVFIFIYFLFRFCLVYLPFMPNWISANFYWSRLSCIYLLCCVIGRIFKAIFSIFKPFFCYVARVESGFNKISKFSNFGNFKNPNNFFCLFLEKRRRRPPGAAGSLFQRKKHDISMASMGAPPVFGSAFVYILL